MSIKIGYACVVSSFVSAGLFGVAMGDDGGGELVVSLDFVEDFIGERCYGGFGGWFWGNF